MVVLARRRSRPYPISVRHTLSQESLERIERQLYGYMDDVVARAATKITSMAIMAIGSPNTQHPPVSQLPEHEVEELVLKHYIDLDGNQLILKPKAIKDQV